MHIIVTGPSQIQSISTIWSNGVIESAVIYPKTPYSNTGAGQINKAIQQLDQVIQQNAATSEEMAATGEELAAQAEHLQNAIAFFKVDLSDGEGLAIRHRRTNEKVDMPAREGIDRDHRRTNEDEQDAEFERY